MKGTINRNIIKIIFSLTLYVVFGFSAVSYADSWVLWTKITTDTIKNNDARSSVRWEVKGGYPAYEQCIAQIQPQILTNKKANSESFKPILKQIDIVGNTLIYSLGNEQEGYTVFTEEFLCLPGTLDPREKK